jgi:hypothetical protein
LSVGSSGAGAGAGVRQRGGRHVELRNTGAAVYNDSPGSITIRTGKTALGFVTFEVPKASRVVAVQFAMDSGFSDDVGEWRVS